MKPLLRFLVLTSLALTRLQALETADVAAVAKRFDSPSGDDQYAARMDLNRLVAEATAPGKGDATAVTKVLLPVLNAPETSTEARKYLIRSLARIGTGDAVTPLASLLETGVPLLQEEARQALSLIPSPGAVAALEAAFRKSTGKRERAGLVDALGVQASPGSVAVLAPVLLDPDPALAGAALSAIARIGGAPAVAALQTAIANPQLASTLRADAERALLLASSGETGIARKLYDSSSSGTVKLAAFQALLRSADSTAKTALVEEALRSSDAGLRHAALPEALALNVPAAQAALQAMDRMPLDDRLVVLANLHRLQPQSLAEQIALRSSTAAVEDERVGAILALGKINTKPAFEAVLQAMGAREPKINQAGATALPGMAYPEADSALTAMLQGSSSPDKLLAVKALVFRQVPGAPALLMSIVKGADEVAAKEALKTIYAGAGLDELKALCQEAATTTNVALRPSLISVCSKIAGRINTSEAKDLVKALK